MKGRSGGRTSRQEFRKEGKEAIREDKEKGS
jgi:hypothetical protein